MDLDKIYYINNGVDLGIYHRQQKEDWLPDEDLDRKDTFKVMYTGSMGVANSVQDILDAAILLKDTRRSSSSSMVQVIRKKT